MICQLIIIFAVVSIFFALAYAVYYLTRDPGTADSELMDSLQELSHFFELQGENRPPDDEQGEGESKSNVPESEERVRDMVNALLLSPKMPEREDLKAVLDGLMPQILEGCEDLMLSPGIYDK